MKARGFTLVELVMVIVITGILAATVTIFFKSAIDSYFDTRRRADMTDIADTALRRMGQDIRRAVPNSIRSVSPSCFQLVPTIAGGRYRLNPDTDPSHAGSQALDITQPVSSFDVLSPMAVTPAMGDWVVIDNQNADDVYATTPAINRAAIDSVTGPVLDTVTGTTTLAQKRITVDADTGTVGIQSFQFPSGYDGGRFVVVPNTEQTVFYSCVGNTLYRTVAAFGANQATTCAATSGAIVATSVQSCAFVYDPNQGATQQSGFVWMRLELRQSGESVALAHGVHVDNVP